MALVPQLGGNASRSRLTFRPMPMTTRPDGRGLARSDVPEPAGGERAFDQDAGDLAAVDADVVGPLDPGVAPGPARDDLGRRHRGQRGEPGAAEAASGPSGASRAAGTAGPTSGSTTGPGPSRSGPAGPGPRSAPRRGRPGRRWPRRAGPGGQVVGAATRFQTAIRRPIRRVPSRARSGRGRAAAAGPR